MWIEDTKCSRHSPQDKQINRKKIHVPPRTAGITADYLQYIIHTGLCRLCWLLVLVCWPVWVKEWAIVTMVQAARYRFWTPVETCDFFFSEMSRQAVGPPSFLFKGYRDSSLGWGVELTTLLHLVARVKNEWSCTSAPPLCLHAMDKTASLNTVIQSGRL